jgi:hypothetical protein
MRGFVGLSRYEVEHLYKAPMMPAMLARRVMNDSYVRK